jgi:hypothetical protein
MKPWQLVSTAQISEIFQCRRDYVSQRRFRGHLPPGLPMGWFRGSERFNFWHDVLACFDGETRTFRQACSEGLGVFASLDELDMAILSTDDNDQIRWKGRWVEPEFRAELNRRLAQ